MDEGFVSSTLGTKEYWDDAYHEELQNFHEIGDEGEIWFGPESVEKMVDSILDHYPIPTDSTESPSILEIGCGNGMLLFAAHEAGYNPGKMHGIDYSENAISLAKSVASKKETRDATLIKFTKHDFLTEDIPRDDTTSGGWDLILDKGTFDAISLGKKDESGHAPHQLYPQRLSALMKPGGRFLITSCNFTEDELKSVFLKPEAGLVYHSRIQHPTFTFGGQSGSIVVTLAFEKPQ
ncbi:S-adenosyl-L-methionine-dependent methyltransferase [Thelephora terrestris]|uniref:Protein-lysine N-methyltransferase EFM4 n=1 Tax=Thelephora terrestris TaxID=56493 RepID=A0A9P6L8R5_9AGAM|nr:S-adenosyl-L-methionine-dependent methyltransferase [Thelephora terrestris]